MASTLVREIQDSMKQSARMSNPVMMGKKFPDQGALKLEFGKDRRCVCSIQNRKENEWMKSSKEEKTMHFRK